MRRFSIPLGLTLAALSLLAARTPVQAGERPIQAEGRGILEAREEFFITELLGWGKGGHLGRCSLLIPLDFNELIQDGNFVALNLQLRAANRDQLYAAVDLELDPGTGIIAGTITFTGGTGRFADATGSACLLIVPDTSWFYYGTPIDGTRFSWALEGTIDY